MEQIGLLRSRLREAHPALYRHFERSWEIALDAWLPAIGVNLGSLNSYPHLRNIENHLDQILQSFESLPNTAYTERLSPMEIYMLLSVVLFHDFGRTQSDTKEAGHNAQKLLRDWYAHLGIPSLEIARSLGRICAFHHPSEDEPYPVLARNLSEIVIDPYGKVREPFLAALLTLADHMDAAFTRTLPLYVAGPEEIDPVGLFRRHILGVYVDPFARLVRTVLVSEEKKENDDAQNEETGKKEAKEKRSRYIVRLNKARVKEWKDLLGVTEDKSDEAFSMCEDLFWQNIRWSRKWNPDKIQKGVKKATGIELRAIEAIDLERGRVTRGQLEQRLNNITKNANGKLSKEIKNWRKNDLVAQLTPLDRFLGFGLIHLERVPRKSRERQQRGFILPPNAPITLVLGDMHENCEMLPEIGKMLAANGIYVAAWVVEHKEHLYNEMGYETYEPIFDGDYLKRVADGMWKLSGQVFGVSQFSYEDLAAHIGEPIVEKVCRAVRRIAIVTNALPWKDDASKHIARHQRPYTGSSVGTRMLPVTLVRRAGCGAVRQEEPAEGAIQAANVHWEWRIGRDTNGYCQCVSRKEVCDKIDTLEPPQADRDE